MIGKVEWFKVRKYGGWGLTPKTWQGWVYIIVMIMVLLIPLHFLKNNLLMTKIITGVWIFILLADVIDMMMHLKKDEREERHEALADRNAAWSMVTILAIGVVSETTYNGLNGIVRINYTAFAALIIGALVKGITFIYLDKKD